MTGVARRSRLELRSAWRLPYLADRWAVVVAVVISLSLAGGRVTQAAGGFSLIPNLPGVPFGPDIFGMSADGRTIVGRAGLARPAIKWTAVDGTVELDELWGFDSVAMAASYDGSTLVGYSTALEEFPFRQAVAWDGSGRITNLGALFEPAPNASVWAATVSDDGSVIAGFSDSPQGRQAFRWTQATGMLGLGGVEGGINNGGFLSAIGGMSADGSILVGVAATAMGNEAVTWSESTGFVSLGDLQGGKHSSSAFDTSVDGSVVVGRASSAAGFRAFRWTSQEGMVDLGSLPGATYYGAVGTTGDGSVVVGDFEGPRGLEAFIWDTARGMRPLTDVLVNDYGFSNIADLASGGFISVVEDISRDGAFLVGDSWIADLRVDLVPGDANFDGMVDLADFGTLKANFGKGRYRNQGDFTADGRVDLTDFGVLKENFGGDQAAVPEPSTLHLLAIAGGLFAMRRVTRGRRSDGRV